MFKFFRVSVKSAISVIPFSSTTEYVIRSTPPKRSWNSTTTSTVLCSTNNSTICSLHPERSVNIRKRLAESTASIQAFRQKASSDRSPPSVQALRQLPSVVAYPAPSWYSTIYFRCNSPSVPVLSLSLCDQ